MVQERRAQNQHKKNGLRAIILCLIIVVGSDSILRVLDAYNVLWEPNDWGDRSIVATKINEAMGLFSQNQGKFKIVVVGDSMVEIALDPILLDSFFNNKTITYNFGIAATAIKSQTVYLRKVILPKIKPDFVIWHINPVDFWNWIMVNVGDAKVLETPMGRYYTGNTSGLDFYGNVNQFLLQVSALYKYRGYFVPPWLDFSIYSGLLTDPQCNGYLRAYDKGYSSNDTAIINQPGIVPFEEGYPVSFDNQAVDLFLENLNFVQAEGLEYLVVYGPFHHYNYTFPELDNILGSLPQEKFLNLNGNESLMYDDLYYNYHHLNAFGAQIFTNFVFEKVKDRIESMLPV